MANEVNERPGGVQHPEEGSPVVEGEKIDGEAAVDTSREGDSPGGGADKLKGADAYGERGGEDLGRGGD